ncbi:MAG: aminotransferase class V-fold PLP-dependent enzyme [Bifidobacterium sp.]
MSKPTSALSQANSSRWGRSTACAFSDRMTNEQRIGTVAFEIDGVHPHDVGQFIDAQGIAIRVGHHCAQPVHRHFGVYASNRASSGIYNCVEDAQALVEALKKVRPFFGVK